MADTLVQDIGPIQAVGLYMLRDRDSGQLTRKLGATLSSYSIIQRCVRNPVKSNRILRYLYFVAVAFVFLIGAMFFYCGVTEEYFPLYPAIDTNFAAGFSETAFGNVEIGMGEEEVRKMLVEPLWTQKTKDGTTKWWYSGDGKSRWGDFAWLARSLTIKDGSVLSIERRVYYD